LGKQRDRYPKRKPGCLEVYDQIDLVQFVSLTSWRCGTMLAADVCILSEEGGANGDL
jgi:hypothetical protein